MAAASMVRPISAVLVLTSGAAAVTVTVSASAPSSSETSTRTVSETRRTMPLRCAVLNPSRVASTT